MIIDFFVNRRLFFVMCMLVGFTQASAAEPTGVISLLDLFLDEYKSSPNVCKFIEKYKPTPMVCELIEANKEKFVNFWNLKKHHKPVKNFKILPGFYCKGPQVNRVINAARLRNYIT